MDDAKNDEFYDILTYILIKKITKINIFANFFIPRITNKKLRSKVL
jgi:hypothetical protein